MNRFGVRQWLSLGLISLPTLLLSIDTGVLYLALPELSMTLHASSTQQLWIMDIYGFMMGCFIIPMGSIGDRIGYRKLLIVGSACFGFASIVAAFSPTPIILIAARALMGIAGATLMPSTLALIRNIFVFPEQRRVAISVWMSCFMGGMIVGPLVGGMILEHFWSGAVFLLGVPVMLIIIVIGKVLLPEYPHNLQTPLDGIGVTLMLASILPFVYGISDISRSDDLQTGIASISAGIVFGFVFVQRQRATQFPLLNLELFSSKIFTKTLSTMLLTAVIMGGVAFYVAQYLQLVIGFSPLNAGLWMIPQAAAMIVSSLMVPKLAKHAGENVLIAAGFFLAAVGMLLLAFLPAQNGLHVLMTGFLLAIAGVSPILILGTEIVIGAAPPEQSGTAGSLSEASNQLGVALGIALLGSIGNYVYHKSVENVLPGSLAPDAVRSIHESFVDAISIAERIEAPSGEALLLAVKNAYVSGFQIVALIGCVVFCILCFSHSKNLLTTIKFHLKNSKNE